MALTEIDTHLRPPIDLGEHDLRSLINTYELALLRLDDQADALRSEPSTAVVLDDSRPAGSPSGSTQPIPPWKFFRTLTIQTIGPLFDKGIASIQREREHLSRQLKHHRRLLSMMRIQSIPAEIWGEIFFHLLPEDEYWHWDASYNPIRLGCVCRHWRRIVLSTPGLWCSLALQLDQSQRLIQKEILQLWMIRSGSMPLSLEFSWYSGRGQDAWFVDNVYTLIEPSSLRWRSLSLALPDHSVKQLLAPPMPSLQKLEVIMSSSVHPPPITASSSPLLHSFSVPGIYQDPSHFRIPWDQLRIFNSQYCLKLPEVMKLLRGCPHLEQCRIRIVTMDGGQPTMVMPKLASLSITSGTGENVGFALDSLRLPSLSELRLYHCTAATGPPWPKAEVLSLVARSSCSLTRLSVQNFPSCDGDAMECIENIRSLADLRITKNHHDIVTDHERELLLLRHHARTLAQRNKLYIQTR